MKILKNQTLSPIVISDVGISVPASPATYTIPEQDYLLWAASSNIVTQIGNGNIVVSDGSFDLSISEGTDLIKGLFPKEITSTFKNDSVDNKNNLKITQTLNLFGYYFAQTDHSLWSNRKITGSGAINLNTQRAAIVLSNTTANGDSAAWETKQVIRYTVGKGHVVSISATVGAGKSGLTKRWGYFSDTNGWYFSQEDNINYVVKRSNVSGSTVDTKIAQSSWNLDKLDGTGPSGINWNFSNGGVYIIEFTWHGNGLIRFGVQYEGKNVYVHQLMEDNQAQYVSVRNPVQPVKVEIVNTNTTASSSEFNLHAVSANKYGFQEVEPVAQFSASRNFNEKGMVDNAYRPLIAIRPKLLFNGRVNRVLIRPTNFTVYSDSQPLYIRVWLNPTTVTAASWVNVDNQSSVEYDISATAISGGTLIYEDYVAAGVSILSGSTSNTNTGGIAHYVLGLNIDATIADTLFIEARSLGGGSNTTAAIRWEEFQ